MVSFYQGVFYTSGLKTVIYLTAELELCHRENALRVLFKKIMFSTPFRKLFYLIKIFSVITLHRLQFKWILE